MLSLILDGILLVRSENDLQISSLPMVEQDQNKSTLNHATFLCDGQQNELEQHIILEMCKIEFWHRVDGAAQDDWIMRGS